MLINIMLIKKHAIKQERERERQSSERNMIFGKYGR